MKVEIDIWLEVLGNTAPSKYIGNRMAVLAA